MMGQRGGMAMIVAVVMRVIVIMGMIVVVPAVVVPAVIVPTVAVIVTMVMIIGWWSGDVAPLRAEARQLKGAREEHQGDESRDVDCFLDEIADLEAKQIDPVARGGEISPDQDRHRGQQHDANPAPTGQQPPQALPIHGTQPEGDPAHQGEPRPQQREHRPHHIENRLEQRSERLKQVDDRIHVRAA